MHDDQTPQCIIRTSPNHPLGPIDVTYLQISATENLLDHHEELISTPLEVKFQSTVCCPSFRKRTLDISMNFFDLDQ